LALIQDKNEDTKSKEKIAVDDAKAQTFVKFILRYKIKLSFFIKNCILILTFRVL
jgi:hypothetical protein